MNIKTWAERCEEHPDHNGIVTNRMIQARMQEEADDLRDEVERLEKICYDLHKAALEALWVMEKFRDQAPLDWYYDKEYETLRDALKGREVLKAIREKEGADGKVS
jgi:hypothetical protein